MGRIILENRNVQLFRLSCLHLSSWARQDHRWRVAFSPTTSHSSFGIRPFVLRISEPLPIMLLAIFFSTLTVVSSLFDSHARWGTTVFLCGYDWSLQLGRDEWYSNSVSCKLACIERRTVDSQEDSMLQVQGARLELEHLASCQSGGFWHRDETLLISLSREEREFGVRWNLNPSATPFPNTVSLRSTLCFPNNEYI